MKWILLVAGCLVACGGLLLVLHDHERDDDERMEDALWGVGPARPGEPDGGLLTAEGVQSIGVVRQSGGAPRKRDTHGWRQSFFRWPEGAERVTGKVLLAAIDEQVDIRFMNRASMRAFEATVFLEGIPEDPVELQQLPEIAREREFMVEDHEYWLLIGPLPPDR